MTKIYNKVSEKEKRRELRKKSADAESFLWEYLKNGKVEGIRFKRQYSVERFVLDFYAPKLKLAIEVDGPIHDKKEQAEHDEMRSDFLLNTGIKFIRFKNEEIQNNIFKVIERIKKIVNK